MTTKRQFTGSNARLAYKPEKESGVLVAAKSSTATGVTAAAVNPGGDMVMVTAEVSGLKKNDVILLGDGDNQEILSVKDITGSKKKLTLDPGTPVNFRHEAGETVTRLDSIGGWYDLGGVTSFTPRGERAVEESAAFGVGIRAVSNTVLGRYEVGGRVD